MLHVDICVYGDIIRAEGGGVSDGCAVQRSDGVTIHTAINTHLSTYNFINIIHFNVGLERLFETPRFIFVN
jgi:hypothetical protein